MEQEKPESVPAPDEMNWALIIGIAAFIGVLILVIFIAAIICCRRKKYDDIFFFIRINQCNSSQLVPFEDVSQKLTCPDDNELAKPHGKNLKLMTGGHVSMILIILEFQLVHQSM